MLLTRNPFPFFRHHRSPEGYENRIPLIRLLSSRELKVERQRSGAEQFSMEINAVAAKGNRRHRVVDLDS